VDTPTEARRLRRRIRRGVERQHDRLATPSITQHDRAVGARRGDDDDTALDGAQQRTAAGVIDMLAEDLDPSRHDPGATRLTRRAPIVEHPVRVAFELAIPLDNVRCESGAIE
jgi:hypothetical protein